MTVGTVLLLILLIPPPPPTPTQHIHAAYTFRSVSGPLPPPPGLCLTSLSPGSLTRCLAQAERHTSSKSGRADCQSCTSKPHVVIKRECNQRRRLQFLRPSSGREQAAAGPAGSCSQTRGASRALLGGVVLQGNFRASLPRGRAGLPGWRVFRSWGGFLPDTPEGLYKPVDCQCLHWRAPSPLPGQGCTALQNLAEAPLALLFPVRLGSPVMPVPRCSGPCGGARPAALRRPRTGGAVCRSCFCSAFEAEVLSTLQTGRLLPPGAVVAVGASGGKDSTVLAHVLQALDARHALGLDLRLVAVDEGIGGYRDAALAAVRRQAARWQLPLTVVAYADLFGGWTMDEVARRAAQEPGRARACCTFCGVLRRRALEEGAQRVGATHIVTGHNADDMAETVLMNFLRGDSGRLARGGTLGSPGEGGALPRCRPLQFASQKEIVLYAHFQELDYFSEECVYAPEAFRGHVRDLLKALEAARPSVVLDLVHSAERLALAPAARPPPPGACTRCGALASRPLCQACALLDGLNRGRPRLAIGKGRKGLGEEGEEQSSTSRDRGRPNRTGAIQAF